MTYDDRDQRSSDHDPSRREESGPHNESSGQQSGSRYRRRTWGERALSGSAYSGGSGGGYVGGGSFGTSGYGGQVYGADRHTGGSHYSGIGHAGSGSAGSGSAGSGSEGSGSEGSPGPHSGKGPKRYRRSDEKIIEEASDSLERHGHVDASDVEVECKDGVITLSGTVDSRRTKREAEAAVEYVFGVRDVMNELRIKRPTDEEPVRSTVSKSHEAAQSERADSAGNGSSTAASKR